MQVLLSGGDKQQSQAEQLQAANVIIIKYANVSTSTTTTTSSGSSSSNNTPTGEQQNSPGSSDEIKVFKLYDEPLSVQVIESRFAQSVQLFDVSRNQLSTLSKDLFCPLSNEVRQLNISHNLLENFDCLGLISQAGQLCLSELRVLDMSHNLIKHLPATGVATLHNLEHLDLSHNLIESLDELSLSALFKLTRLDLSANKIQQLPLRIFHKSSSMRHLSLQSNQLQTNLTHAFLAGLTALEELDLSHNNISHLADAPFTDKLNLTRVDLRHNLLSGLRKENLRVTSIDLQQQQQHSAALATTTPTAPTKHRLHHNGELASTSSISSSSKRQQQATPALANQSANIEFLLSGNPFVCDCQLEWLRNSPQHHQPISAIKRTVLTPQVHDADALGSSLQNDQPVISATEQQQQQAAPSNNNTSESHISQQTRLATALLPANQPPPPLVQLTGRVADLDLVKCTPLFRRNTPHNQRQQQQQQQHHHSRPSNSQRALAPSDGAHHIHNSHNHHSTGAAARQRASTNHQLDGPWIDLLTADSSNFLCSYKLHCFALCQCCEFDACDCEMICPAGCNCYYNLNWQTNIIDCSSSNHTVVPPAIPMDVSGLYLDGNNIDSLKPSNLIARKSLKSLYLNSTNLEHIANRTFNGLIELHTLYLHDNKLSTLNGYEFEPLAQLRALYLQSNRLEHISNQTFNYLRSLEVLDLSNNRLTSANLDLFWSIGHHNIRLRQLSIAHNWWSCQCSSINRFRSILKQKFLLNGSVTIADKNQLRCYYNSTTVGPLVLGADSAASGAILPQQPPMFSSNRQQLTEINQCSESEPNDQAADVNPPLIQAPSEQSPALDVWPPPPPMSTVLSRAEPPIYPLPSGYLPPPPPIDFNSISGQTTTGSGRSVGGAAVAVAGAPLASFLLFGLVLAAIGVIVVALFMFVSRQQQRFRQSHHKKSSANSSASSASSSVSSTAISSLNGTKQLRHQQQHHSLHQQQQHHLIMSSNSGQATTTTIGCHHIQQPQLHLHQHSGSSQSNIYAALVGPQHQQQQQQQQSQHRPSNGTTNNANLYSNSSASSQSAGQPAQLWHQSLYNQPAYLATDAHYAVTSASQAPSYKTVGASLYQAAACQSQVAEPEWLRLPKVKQFVSKLVSKSLALGGYRSSSRDELATIASDKIYDAFISYDKRDEQFVMQHLSAELEYGQPQYRVADRYRDLPQPSSAYIAEAITSVIGCSHRSIIVLTDNYLASDWCRYELQAALQESSLDKSHKIIAVILDPKCLLEMDGEMRALLTNSHQVSMYQPQQQQQQLVQVDSAPQLGEQQLVASLNGHGNQVSTCTSTQLATSKIAFLNYNERKFWQKLKQLMPAPRPSSQTLTLTTKN